MPILYYLLMAAVVLIVGLSIFVATRPAEFRIERRGEVGAPPAVVYGMINDFHRWAEWSPWEKLDPAMKKIFEGQEAGKGAVYAWSGNKKAGKGKLTILESKPGEKVVVKLEFFEPYSATNQATFILTPSGAGTHVVWFMEGKNNFMGKAFCLVMDMDKMVGKDFAEGLANMDAVARKSAV